MGDPAYLQVARSLREQVEDGRLQPGGPLLGIKQICSQYRQSQQTVSKALRFLEREGLIVRVPGRTYHVSGSPGNGGPGDRGVVQMTASTPARVRVRTPEALVALVPHLLGFMPQASMVVIGTEAARGTVKVTFRYELSGPSGPERARNIAGHAAAVLAGKHLTAAVVVGYGPDELVRPVAVALGEAMAQAGIVLAQCLRVDSGRYWSCTCNDKPCCPQDGVPFDAAGHAVPAIMATGGQQILPDRAAVVATLAPVTGEAAESMRKATGRAGRRVRRSLAKARESGRPGEASGAIVSEGIAAVASMIAAYRGGGECGTDNEVAWLTVALRDIRVRDDAWARMDPADRDAHRRLWTDVVRRAQRGYVAAPAALLALVAWQDGNGVLANVALDRALADNPGYLMATHLRLVITGGVSPSKARPPMTPEQVAAWYDELDNRTGDRHRATRQRP